MKLKNITTRHILTMLNNYNHKHKMWDFSVSHSKQDYWTRSESLHETDKSIKDAQVHAFYKSIEPEGEKRYVLYFNFVYDNNEKLKCVDVYFNNKNTYVHTPSHHTHFGIKVKSITKGKYQILNALVDKCLHEQKKKSQRERAKRYRENRVTNKSMNSVSISL